MLHALAAFAMTAAVAGTSSNEPPHRTLMVQLVHRCPPRAGCVTTRILTSMKREAERVWSSLDVRLAWIDSTDSVAPRDRARLIVMLEEAAYPDQEQEHASVLAALTQPSAACGTGLAHVWVRQVDRYAALVRRGEGLTSLPAALADMFLARALGRALAHEIGHYLLGTREHTRHGLMRAEFLPQDLLEDTTAPLYRLDAQTRAAIVACRTD
jgi:hypothetical protein